MRWMFLILFMPFQTLSSTCIGTEDKSFIWNQKYSHLVSVTAHSLQEGYTVEIEVPLEIENFPFKMVGLFVDSMDDPTLFTMLYANQVDGKYVAWYSVKRELIRKQYVLVDYSGEGCDGIAVTKQVVFS